MAADVAGTINNPSPNEDEQTVREYLLPGALPQHVFSTKTIGKRLKQHLDEPVRSGERTLVLRSWEDHPGTRIASSSMSRAISGGLDCGHLADDVVDRGLRGLF